MTALRHWPLACLFCVICMTGCKPHLPNIASKELSFSTEASDLPAEVIWREIGFARELINIRDLQVVVSGGESPISASDWEAFRPRLPWVKNISRHLLFDSTAFYRSPGVPADCEGNQCYDFVTYKGYTWLALATPLAVDFIPEGSKTNMLQPDPGILVVKTIAKCQAILFNDHIYRLADPLGNAYVMHATETGRPTLEVALPEGWTLRKVQLESPLIVAPFGGGDACYFNILGDHLGQGYHQYVFADSVYPSP